MRVAITGTHGVGKSTLALLLATELQLPLIEEIARAAAERMGYASTQQIVKANIIDKQRFQEAILSCQINAEFRHYAKGFVADRSVIDVAAYAAWYKLPEAIEMRKHAVEYARRNYDLLFYLPLGDWPAEDDGFRLTDRKSQEQIDALIGKMISKLNNVVMITSCTPGERLGEALTWVGTLRRLRATRPEEMISDVAALSQHGLNMR